jgi:periplasmic protein TonB
MAHSDNSFHYGSDATAFALTVAVVGLFLVILRDRFGELRPAAAHDQAFELTMQMEQAPAPQPPTPPPPQPRKTRPHPTVQLAQKPLDPVPVVSEAASPEALPAVPDPVPESAPASASDPDLNAQYAAELLANIDRRTFPPDSAQYRLQHPSGEVRVRFTVMRSGECRDVAVLRSSGSALLDDAAVNIVSSGHYPPMPVKVFVGEAMHLFIVTVEFRAAHRAR